MSQSDEPTPTNETDSRFPSGPWKGFFLQKPLPGQHWMQLELTFREGLLRGTGGDWVGQFVLRGRYELDSGKCWFSKQYVGAHTVSYEGLQRGQRHLGSLDDPQHR